MIEGNWTANQWPNYGLASTGMWGFEQEFRDVCLSSWSTGETAKYSAILAPGRVYEFCIPENRIVLQLQNGMTYTFPSSRRLRMSLLGLGQWPK